MDRFITLVRKEFRSSLLDYLLLLTGSILFLIFLKIFQGQRTMSFLVTLGFVILYIFWGVFHHSTEKSLNIRSVIEYVLIGLTIFLLLTIVFT